MGEENDLYLDEKLQVEKEVWKGQRGLSFTSKGGYCREVTMQKLLWCNTKDNIVSSNIWNTEITRDFTPSTG